MQTIITGSFSKILAPGLRMGWVVAPPGVMEQTRCCKTGIRSPFQLPFPEDCISNTCADEDIDARIRTISAAYRNQCDLMIRMFEELLPGVRDLHPALRRDVRLAHAARRDLVHGCLRTRPPATCRRPPGHPVLRRRGRAEYTSGSTSPMQHLTRFVTGVERLSARHPAAPGCVIIRSGYRSNCPYR